MLKKIVIGFLLLAVAGGIVYYVLDEQKPSGETGEAAEALTDKMLEAIGQKAYDKTNWLMWDFPRGHHYVWNKKKDLVEIKWEDNSVLLNTKTITGKAFKNGELLSGEEAESMIKEAWSFFANDSFWLVAPFKVRDPGTTRELVEHEGKDALLVAYSSGGVTPGDAYLWLLDDNYKPTAWKMWVQIIPTGGAEFSWDCWKEYGNDLWLSSCHDGLLELKLDNIKVGKSYKDLKLEKDPFKDYEL